MRFVFLVTALAATTVQAAAGEFGKNADRPEVRLGGGIYDAGILSNSLSSDVVVNGEVLLPSPSWLEAIGSPRPYVGMDAGLSSDAVHFLYAGLNWDYHLTQRLYLSASLGGAVHTADSLVRSSSQQALGSRVLFHVGAAVGYDFTPNFTGQVYANHFSNAGLASPNDGQDSAGIRFGYRF